jgi:glutathione S-transferase
MIRLYHASRTRSVRIYWLLEELGLPYELETVAFAPSATPFSQQIPVGKFPVIQDEGQTLFESGAILEYVLDRYDDGRLAPKPGAPLRGEFLQWVHFAEATLMPPLVEIYRHVILKPESQRIPSVVVEARARAVGLLRMPEKALDGKQYLLATGFSGADVMLGYSLHIAESFDLLSESFPNLSTYMDRLKTRSAFKKAVGAA